MHLEDSSLDRGVGVGNPVRRNSGTEVLRVLVIMSGGFFWGGTSEQRTLSQNLLLLLTYNLGVMAICHLQLKRCQTFDLQYSLRSNYRALNK